MKTMINTKQYPSPNEVRQAALANAKKCIEEAVGSKRFHEQTHMVKVELPRDLWKLIEEKVLPKYYERRHQKFLSGALKDVDDGEINNLVDTLEKEAGGE